MGRMEDQFLGEAKRNMQEGQPSSMLPMEYAASKFIQGLLGFFLLTILVLTHYHIGKRVVSLRKTIPTLLAGGFVLFIVISATNTHEIGILLTMYLTVLVVTLAQRFYTAREKRRGNPQFPHSFGIPVLTKIGLPENFSRRLIMLLSAGVALWVMQFSSLLGWWLFIGAFAFSIVTAMSMDAVEKDRDRMETEMLKAEWYQQQKDIQETKQVVEQERTIRQEQKQPQPVSHQVREVEVKPVKKRKSQPEQDYGDLLDG